MMPRTCLACSSPNRSTIDAALATGEALREIAVKSRISISALHRHKTHAGQAIVRAAEKREESLGESTMARLETLYRRTEKILDSAETSGDHRLALQAVREARENLAGIFALANKAAEKSGVEGPGFRISMVHIGEAPVHEWDVLPASAVTPPYREAGWDFYKCRKHVGNPPTNN